MADSCATNVELIYEDENIGDSLPKINNNFSLLKNAACQIETQLDNIVNVRTFFYYGPNAATDSESGVNSGNLTLPSTTTIQNFVNRNDALNLPSVSETGDIAYVIYQKTGWYGNAAQYYRAGSGSVPYTRDVQEQRTRTEKVRRIGIGWTKRDVTYWVTVTQTFYAGYSWSANINDTYNIYTPIFVIYKLTFDGSSYNLNVGFPKFTHATTGSSINWNNPSTWSTY
jgi:hypothetical protein